MEGITRSAWKAQQVLTTEHDAVTIRKSSRTPDMTSSPWCTLSWASVEVNPTGMVRQPVCLGNKLRSKNLEVDFLVVDVPTAYNVILGRPTLHRSHGPHRRPTDAHPHSGGRPRNSCPPEMLGPASPGLYVNTRGYWRHLTGSLAPWPGPPQLRPLPAPPLVGAATPSFRLHGRPDQPSAFPSAAGTE
ncbi:LOW QUALITY PROTEIN: hypothetical protein Cgig2_009016 [Carnegiea gigantea]|uniref:Uncharacterized protein n=1 Tax=Carnegiea gigantea TaxID=171969 RepID=A0A9Q1KE03_9CARY|nr:LOW QUALITY PROTEIN: hypothetical protein Cgig2_009016 [Carnegiea gigantea]